MELLLNDKWLDINPKNLIFKKSYFSNNIKLSQSHKIRFTCSCGKLCEKSCFIRDLIKEAPKCRICLTKRTSLIKYGTNSPNQSKIVQKKSQQTNLKKLGVKYPSQSKEVRSKIEKINLKNFGVKYPAQSAVIKEKTKQTNLLKYGVNYTFQNKEIQKKIQKINLERHGVKYGLLSKKIQRKRKKTMLKKFGVNYPFQSGIIQNKVKQTNLIKYGVENQFQLDEVKEKLKQTNLKKYGTKNPAQSKKIQKKMKESCLKKYGVENPFQNKEIKDKINKTNFKIRYNLLLLNEKFIDKITPLFTLEEYLGTKIIYPWQCKKCNTKFEDDLNNGKIPRCPTCFPKLSGTSQYEKEISEWLKSLNIKTEENNRSIISPLELDIFLPDFNLAIEFDGLYWHSELQGKDSKYHLNKTNLCKEKNIYLIHIYQDEWINKKEIVKSIIKSKLEFFDEKIYAQKCEIKEIDNNDFYENNHIQGQINSKINLGLYYENELVSMLSFSKPRFNKKYDWEITRLCNKLNTKVIGSFGKLFSYFKKNYSGTIITYSDKRYFDGFIYKNNGFQQLNDSKPNYYYTDYKQRYFRSGKKNILTEWQNMQLQGWDRIWDCGNYCFLKA